MLGSSLIYYFSIDFVRWIESKLFIMILLEFSFEDSTYVKLFLEFCFFTNLPTRLWFSSYGKHNL